MDALRILWRRVLSHVPTRTLSIRQAMTVSPILPKEWKEHSETQLGAAVGEGRLRFLVGPRGTSHVARALGKECENEVKLLKLLAVRQMRKRNIRKSQSEIKQRSKGKRPKAKEFSSSISWCDFLHSKRHSKVSRHVHSKADGWPCAMRCDESVKLDTNRPAVFVDVATGDWRVGQLQGITRRNAEDQQLPTACKSQKKRKEKFNFIIRVMSCCCAAAVACPYLIFYYVHTHWRRVIRPKLEARPDHSNNDGLLFWYFFFFLDRRKQL